MRSLECEGGNEGGAGAKPQNGKEVWDESGMEKDTPDPEEEKHAVEGKCEGGKPTTNKD